MIIPADLELCEIWPVRRAGCHRKHISHLKFKKSCKYIIYLLARLLRSCNVKMWGICEDIRTLCSRGQLFTSLSNPKQHKHLKGTHVRVLLTSSSRPSPESRPPRSHLRHFRSSHQAGGVPCSHAPICFVFPAIGALKQWSLCFGRGSPTLDTVLSLSMQSQHLHTVGGLTRTSLIGFWMDF